LFLRTLVRRECVPMVRFLHGANVPLWLDLTWRNSDYCKNRYR
jgi:hypothetical protein